LYISQKTKDAIVDRFNKLQGRRPSVDIHNPDLRINIHISRNHCNVSLDSSGMSLHKRGYRQKTGLAPINEVLAAGLILLSGWKMDCNFIDPMCGSGTFLIEAAMLANNIPPGFYRREFGFQRWKDFDKDLWDKILKDSLKLQTEFPYQIIGSDISEKTIDIASENIVFARLHKDIVLQPSSFEDFNPPAEKGFLIMNPPYGERLVEEKIIDLYKSIGDILKKKYNGYQAWIISSDFDALKFIGLKPSRKIHIFNGPLECKFCKFEVYEGSKKAKKNYK
jgi:putative N6-adenine-specific DNA methylase